MAISLPDSLLLFLMLLALLVYGDAQPVPAPAPVPVPAMRLTDLFPVLSYTKDAHVLFGSHNVRAFYNGSFSTISLDKTSGSGLASNYKHYYGFFSGAMKLPAGYTSGVVVAFYLSNSDVFPHNHDEIDFELLGHQRRREWILQTNIYGNGSVKTGREEKFSLWFDPTREFHDYSIIWNSRHVVFLVDNIPIREVLNTKAMSAYPSKPMSLYVTIWDGSNWATGGGRYPVDYNYAPFVASLGRLEITGGCIYNNNNVNGSCPLGWDPVDGEPFLKLSHQQLQGLNWARATYLVYSYCKDRRRYKVPPAECNTN